jgi:hypothetical protein
MICTTLLPTLETQQASLGEGEMASLILSPTTFNLALFDVLAYLIITIHLLESLSIKLSKYAKPLHDQGLYLPSWSRVSPQTRTVRYSQSDAARE